MELTRDVVVPRDTLGFHDETKWVEVTPNPKVIVLTSFAGGGQVGYHYLLLLPGSQEVTNFRLL